MDNNDTYKLSKIGNGALQALFDKALEKIIKNMDDPNTDPKKDRKIVINLTFKPGESGIGKIRYTVDAKPAPRKACEAVIAYANTDNGAKLQEFSNSGSAMMGQMEIDTAIPEEPQVTSKVLKIGGNKQ